MGNQPAILKVARCEKFHSCKQKGILKEAGGEKRCPWDNFRFWTNGSGSRSMSLLMIPLLKGSQRFSGSVFFPLGLVHSRSLYMMGGLDTSCSAIYPSRCAKEGCSNKLCSFLAAQVLPEVLLTVFQTNEYCSCPRRKIWITGQSR